MASLAISLQLRGKTIDDSRVVFGGIAGKPLRETAVEAFLKGKTLSAELGEQAVIRRPRQCRAAEVQRDEDRYGEGTPGLRPGKVERVDGMQTIEGLLLEPVGCLAEFPSGPFHEIAVRFFGRKGKASPSGSRSYWHLLNLMRSG